MQLFNSGLIDILTTYFDRYTVIISSDNFSAAQSSRLIINRQWFSQVFSLLIRSATHLIKVNAGLWGCLIISKFCCVPEHNHGSQIPILDIQGAYLRALDAGFISGNTIHHPFIQTLKSPSVSGESEKWYRLFYHPCCAFFLANYCVVKPGLKPCQRHWQNSPAGNFVRKFGIMDSSRIHVGLLGNQLFGKWFVSFS